MILDELRAAVTDSRAFAAALWKRRGWLLLAVPIPEVFQVDEFLLGTATLVRRRGLSCEELDSFFL